MNNNYLPDIDILGTLPSYDYSQDNYRLENVYSNKNQTLQYVVKPISKLPVNFPIAKYFTGFSNDIKSFGFVDDIKKGEAERETSVIDFFAETLIIFRPEKNGNFFNLSEVRTVVAKPKNFDDSRTYVPVPIYAASSSSNLDYLGLVGRLLNGKYIGQIKGISTEEEDTPDIIFWKENDFTYKALGLFHSHRYAQGGFLLKCDELKGIDFKQEWFESVILYEHNNPTMAFVDNELYQQLHKELEDAPAISITSMKEDEVNIELEFISNFIKLTRERGFIYKSEDLINFHTAIKSSMLTILSGASGTGKSRLVSLYGEALGLQEDRITIIPVRPAWSDDADLIGFVDSLHMVYRPGDCDLINTLIRASKEPHNLFLVCFDEMNLARVEHYFSQFLSVLELDGSNRYLKLYNPDTQKHLYNGDRYDPRIKIGNNVLFVGTVNIDESTYHFSDKVLDRANVIKLEIADFKELMDITTQNRTTRIIPDEITSDQFGVFCKDESKVSAQPDEIKFLTALRECLNSSAKEIEFGPRIVKQVFKYLTNLPLNNILNRQEGFDRQVTQRILTKVKGPEDQLKPILGSYNPKTDEVEGGSIYEILNQFQSVSSFDRTRQVLKSKAKELKFYGYSL